MLFRSSIFELNKTSGTNDNIVGLSNVTYGGALQVTNLSGTLTSGDSFTLFTASSYAGAFSSLSLPLLNPGLAWTNKLLVDGSIAVVVLAPGDRFWTNVLGGNYAVAGNWLDSQPPLAADNAYFTNDLASYQVDWTANASAANAYFNGALSIVTQDRKSVV